MENPIRFPDQHQGRVHGAGSLARELFSQSKKNGIMANSCKQINPYLL